MSERHSKTGRYIILFSVMGAALFLLMFRLGSRCLWQDEAETALVAETILSHGIPLGTDGKNFFSQEEGTDYGKNYIWIFPWLQNYITAASFRLLGINTFTARLPFALFGAGTVIAVYLLSLALWNNKRTALITAVTLLLSAPFLILLRQCRYYSPAMFFSAFGLYSYINISKKKKRWQFLFFLSAYALFHCSYIYSAALILTAFIHCALFKRPRIKNIIVVSAVLFIVNIPWILFAYKHTAGYAGRYSSALFNIHSFINSGHTFIRNAARYIFPPVLLAVPACRMILSRINKKPALQDIENKKEGISLLTIFIIVSLAGISSSSIAPFFRYMGVLIPVFSIITGLIISSAWEIHITAALGIFIFIGINNLFPAFVCEILNTYKGPLDGIIRYLKDNGSKNDTAAITYGDLPLKFYTGMRVTGGLTGENLKGAENADWIIIRRHTICAADYKVKDYLLKHVQWNRYKKIAVDYPDTAFENSPNPAIHRFRTAKNEDCVILYKRKK